MFSNLGELSDCTQIWNFQNKILDFDELYVVKHENAEPIKYNLITVMIARAKK